MSRSCRSGIEGVFGAERTDQPRSVEVTLCLDHVAAVGGPRNDISAAEGGEELRHHTGQRDEGLAEGRHGVRAIEIQEGFDMTRREVVSAFVGVGRLVLGRQDPGRGLLLQPLPRVPLEDPGPLSQLASRHRSRPFESSVEPERISQRDGQDLSHPERCREQPLHEFVALSLHIHHHVSPSDLGL
jgi:hypothetical protein